MRTYQEMSSCATHLGTLGHSLSQLAKPLWTDPGMKSGISMCKQAWAKKKRGGARGGKGEKGNSVDLTGYTCSLRAHFLDLTEICLKRTDQLALKELLSRESSLRGV